MIYTLEALGSVLEIKTEREIPKSRIDELFDTVFEFEKKYSRFIEWNYLSSLNSVGTAHIDDEGKTLINVGKKLFLETDGEFDMTILPILENMWYGKSWWWLMESIWMDNVTIQWNTIALKNWVQLDFWGVGKGYIIDKIYKKLDIISENFIINFWGDIKVKWTHTIGLEDPNNDTRVIWKISITNWAFCGSSGKKRKFWTNHHLLSARSKASQNDKIAVFVVSKLATLADSYATALFVTPLEKSLQIMGKNHQIEAMIIASNGEIYKTKEFHAQLYEK